MPLPRVYGLDEWTTPIFEDTSVFSRTLGDTSDVVTKEMYTFTDRGGDSLTLAAGKYRRHLPRAGQQRPDAIAAAKSFLRGAPCSATNGRRRAATANSTKSAPN